MSQSRSLTPAARARRLRRRRVAQPLSRQVCSSSASSSRTLASLAASWMRAALMRRIVILSSSSPGETGTRMSFMAADPSNSSSPARCTCFDLDQVHDARAPRSCASRAALAARTPRKRARGLRRRRRRTSAATGTGRCAPGWWPHTEPMTGVPTMVAMCAGPESGVRSTAGAREQRQQLRQGVLADLIDERHAARAARSAAPTSRSSSLGPPQRITRMPWRRTACSATRRVALGAPVAQRVARAGADDSVGCASGIRRGRVGLGALAAAAGPSAARAR